MIRAAIIDDEPSVLSIITHFIRIKNLPIEIVGSAINGRQAIELITHTEPELVFIDIQMPDMTGLEVIARMTRPRYVIITAHDRFSYAQQALRLGVKDIILKPVEYKQLISSISRAVGWEFTGSSMVNDILEYINLHYAEHISVTQISQMFFTTASHIARLFKQHIGIGVVAYINQVRINEAIQLMQGRQYSIKEIAEMTGYESLNNFYKYFKLQTGMTPAAFANGKIKECSEAHDN